ncbi:carbon-nitrogen hydrolase family protein [Acidovorax sp. sic0104]|uniref:carbon-nitrogen hydrolase family protein n=1 Tax=Acidovorax sp. sic0104 TaxID=2854784 RepID=UPI001C4814FC|nr:carbon-nitrogen hydrolase family protein [Acidovorax sp. sic0104]MBV7543259.1 carbon-nitrogen hydrolase family protein [Acidovorax sp. sic0104]
MRITVCELPYQPALLDPAWAALCAHTRAERSELVLLPEFAFAEPVWETLPMDPARWDAAVALSDAWQTRLHELGARWVVGARPVTDGARRFNEGFAWSPEGGHVPLRRKFHLPDEPGGWEARWFERGDAAFSRFEAGELAFGLNICSELWALETYGTYAAQAPVQAILSPRATAAATTAKWLAVGTVAAVRTGAYSLSSNRVDSTAGTYGGTGWAISPDGVLLARTSPTQPFVTVDLDLQAPAAAQSTYPRYVFSATAPSQPAPAP